MLVVVVGGAHDVTRQAVLWWALPPSQKISTKKVKLLNLQ